MRIRTFIAVPVTPSVRKGALKLMNLLRPVTGDVKWVAPDNLHWTLQFLGDVDQDHIAEICSGITTAVAQFEPFTLGARGAGAFPTNNRPRTLWLGVGEGDEAMVAVQAAIQNRLAAIGFRGEQRRYVPHLTLGRAGRDKPSRELSDQLSRLADFEAGSMLVDEIVVYSSTLRREGPNYEMLGHIPLFGGI